MIMVATGIAAAQYFICAYTHMILTIICIHIYQKGSVSGPPPWEGQAFHRPLL